MMPTEESSTNCKPWSRTPPPQLFLEAQVESTMRQVCVRSACANWPLAGGFVTARRQSRGGRCSDSPAGKRFGFAIMNVLGYRLYPRSKSIVNFLAHIRGCFMLWFLWLASFHELLAMGLREFSAPVEAVAALGQGSIVFLAAVKRTRDDPRTLISSTPSDLEVSI